MTDFFSARRPAAYANRAMIATSHPLATSAGLEILHLGGNAVDSAIAAAATQCVVDPLMTGIGGDCFVLYAPSGAPVRALNGSGHSPAAATLNALRSLGLERDIPQRSVHSVTIPGAISAWCRLHADYGSFPLSRLFHRARDYARNGYVVTPRVAMDWTASAGLFGTSDEPAAQVFLPSGRAPTAGQIHAQPLLAERFEDIATFGASAFYGGKTAQNMVDYLQSIGGLHALEDFEFEQHASEWLKPVSVSYRGYEIHECPPNGQGIAALLILKILEGFDLDAMSQADRIHVHAEATKLAYHHRDALIADQKYCEGIGELLLSNRTVSTMRNRIDMRRAGKPAMWDEPEHKDTIYISVVDGDGNAISFINSIFHNFGSTRLDPQSGVLFHSRGSSFRMIEGHPNEIGPRKRPMHTIIPGMVTRNGKTVMSFGVMGGHYQAAGHAALLTSVFDRGLGLQAAMDEPRSFCFDGTLELEPGIDASVQNELAARGHEISIASSPIGGSQAIRIHDFCLEGGSDSRKDGAALGF